MFNESNSTVFILGAGASWHYGYPTGDTLVTKVIEKAAIAGRYIQHSLDFPHTEIPEFLNGDRPSDEVLLERLTQASSDCWGLKRGLEELDPLIIDYYLGWNPQFQDIGRLLIAWVILECEHKSQTGNINRNEVIGSLKSRDDWTRFIIHQIAIHCKSSIDLLSNKVSFVTFNYDVSLEVALWRGLRHIHLFHDTDLVEFLGGARIIHIYGRIREQLANSNDRIDWDIQDQDPNRLGEPGWGDYHAKMKMLLDAAYSASRGLRVIDPHDKGADDAEIEIARAAIAKARRVFILGYGFDEHNSGRLNLQETLRDHMKLVNKRIAFTNYQDINQINKRASKIFYGGPNYFQPGGPAIQDRYEKSIRNTYDALALDFDLAD